MTERIADLRQAPVIGQTYWVPTVEYYWLDHWSIWPVIGAVHHDKEFNFPALHFHIDARFLTARQRLWLIRYDDGSFYSTLNSRPMSEIPEHRWTRLKRPFTALPRRATLRKRKCQVETFAWEVPEKATASLGLARRYPDARAIHRADGRQLCPHRKVDLSQFPADADGLKTCPIHGLRVDCRRIAA